MLKTSSRFRAPLGALGLAATAAIMFAGCKSRDDTHGEAARWDSDAWTGGTGYVAPKEEPKAEPRPEPRRGACNAYRPQAGRDMSVSAMSFPTGEASSSAVQLHQVMPREVRLGKDFNYELHVTNLTPQPLQNVQVKLDSTANQRVTSSTPASAQGPGGATVWNLGDLDGCATQVIRVTARADAAGTSSNCLSVTYNNAFCVATNVVEPALAITKTAPAEVNLCDVIEYRVEVRNSGSAVLNNVRLRDNLPDGLATADAQARRQLDIALDTLQPGQAKSVTIRTKASRVGSYDNTATAVADGDVSANSTRTTTVVRQATLALDAKCGNAILMGRNTTCTFTVRNSSQSPATNVVVRASAPQGTTFVSADNNGRGDAGATTWNIGNLGAGESRTVSMTVRTSAAGTIRCEATATGDCVEAVTAGCTTTIEGAADIGTLLTDVDGVIQTGMDHVYTYEVENQGQINLTNTTVVITLPAGMNFINSNAPQPPQIDGNKLTFRGVSGVLRPGEKRQFQMTVRCTQAGEKLVISETTADQLKTPVRDDELTNFVEP